jgi:hypothetical protein
MSLQTPKKTISITNVETIHTDWNFVTSVGIIVNFLSYQYHEYKQTNFSFLKLLLIKQPSNLSRQISSR